MSLISRAALRSGPVCCQRVATPWVRSFQITTTSSKLSARIPFGAQHNLPLAVLPARSCRSLTTSSSSTPSPAASPSPAPPTSTPASTPPTWLQAFPEWFLPYARLSRWDKPIGTWLLLWPCMWSTALATSIADGWWAAAGPMHSAAAMTMFAVGAFAMRGAGYLPLPLPLPLLRVVIGCD
jgi:hypothetical protein